MNTPNSNPTCAESGGIAIQPGSRPALNPPVTLKDADRIYELGHRTFVGGDGKYWDHIGQLQYDYLLSAGLKPEHVFLDVACGSLRAGRHFIKYLQTGHYIGVDKEVDLLILGVAAELGLEVFKAKRPQFVVTDTFDLRHISQCPDFVMAQSLLTHLTGADIFHCLEAVRSVADGKTTFYATFFEKEAVTRASNPGKSDSLACFYYTRDFMRTLAEAAGWQMEYIGDWGHPRNQKLIQLKPAL